MVLEEANSSSAPLDSSFANDAPQSDQDVYAGDRSPTLLETRDPTYLPVNNGQDQIYVNLNNLPKPVFPWMSSYSRQLRGLVQDSCDYASGILGRPLRQEEADAFGYHAATAIRTSSFGPVITTPVVFLLWARGRKSFRFPFVAMGKNFNPDKLGPLSGKRARLGWQLLRGGAYFVAGSVIGNTFVNVYAVTTSLGARLTDPRLKEFGEKFRNARKSKNQLPGNREVDQTPGPRDGETFEMAKQRQRIQETFRRKRQSAAQGNEDMSPTGGAFAEEFVEDGSWSGNDTSVLSDAQAQQQFTSQQQPQGAPQPRQHSGPSDTQQPRSSDPFATTPVGAESKPAVSSWERLRQQAVSGEQSRPPIRTQQSPSTTSQSSEGFTFSDRDQDKHLAQAEAQRQFDASVEREREGHDFGGSRGRRG